MNILVTGGTGFIGSTLVKTLVAQHHHVIVIDNLSAGHLDNLQGVINRITFISGNVQDFDPDYTLPPLDIIFHLAGIAALAHNQANPALSISSNVSGTANMLELARRHPIKNFIFASTGAVYENSPRLPQWEDHILQPDLTYALGKKWCEELIESYHVNYEMPYTILRYFNIYGTGQQSKKKNPPLISYLIQQIQKNEPISIFSDGQSLRDYLHIDDLNRLHLMVMEHTAKNITINACSGKQYSVQQIFQIIKKYLPTTIELHHKPSADMWNHYQRLFDCKLNFKTNRVVQEVYKTTLGCYEYTKSIYDWVPSIDMEDGIQMIIKDIA